MDFFSYIDIFFLSFQPKEHCKPSKGLERLSYEDAWAPCQFCDGYHFNKICSHYKRFHRLNPKNQALRHDESLRRVK
jgi:hypothetical protein